MIARGKHTSLIIEMSWLTLIPALVINSHTNITYKLERKKVAEGYDGHEVSKLTELERSSPHIVMKITWNEYT